MENSHRMRRSLLLPGMPRAVVGATEVPMLFHGCLVLRAGSIAAEAAPTTRSPRFEASPFKGEVWRGMVFRSHATLEQHHPHPTLPLKGRAEHVAARRGSQLLLQRSAVVWRPRKG